MNKISIQLVNRKKEGKRQKQKETEGNVDSSLPRMTSVFLHLYVRTLWEDRQIHFNIHTCMHKHTETHTHTHPDKVKVK